MVQANLRRLHQEEIQVGKMFTGSKDDKAEEEVSTPYVEQET